MGIYLNPSTREFEKAINSEIYVDKSMMIEYLNSVVNTEQQYVCVSRPRRFGKTTDAEMICAYYDREAESERLFHSLKYFEKESFSDFMGKFDVIHLNMIQFMKEKEADQMVKTICRRVLKDFEVVFPWAVGLGENDLAYTMSLIHEREGRQFVIVIDEWDCIFRQYPDDVNGQKIYLDFLRDWLKDQPYVALAYMTGILPIKKYGEHSALNMFDEYSMTNPMQLASYVGFNEGDVKELCVRYGRNFDDIKQWYDGYVVSGVLQKNNDSETYHVYSPLSVVKAVTTGVLQNYWNKTETYAALKQNINRNFDGLKDIVLALVNGGKRRINTDRYQNDMTTFAGADDVLTLLIHLGYLGFDSRTKEGFVPNKEICQEFENSIEGENEWNVIYDKLNNSQRLLEATWNMDAKTIAELVEAAHLKTANNTYNSEAALSYAIQLAYFNAEQYYTMIPEMQAGKGYADLTYIPSPDYPDKPALLIELKWNKSADTAIEQIHRQKYTDSLSKYKGNIIMVGINYDRDVDNEDEKFKRHTCVVERA